MQEQPGYPEGEGIAVQTSPDDEMDVNDDFRVSAASAPARRRVRWPVQWASGRWRDGWDRRRLWLPIVTAVLIVVALFGIVAGVVRARQPFLMSQQVAQGQLTASFTTTGTLRSAVYDADFVVAGKVATISVKVGQQVRAGDTLATLDDTALKDTVAEAQAAVSGANSVLSGVQSNQNKVEAQANAMVDAASDQEQSDANACKGNQSCIGRAQSKLASVQAQADAMDADAQQKVDQAQAQVSSAQAQLKTAQDNLAGATLKAPHEGTVAAVNGRIGGSSTAQQPFIQIADLAALQVLATVDVNQVGAVKSGNTARFTVPTFQNEFFSGAVSGVSPFGQTSSKGVAYPVTIDVDAQSLNPDHNLLPGMPANVTVVTAQRFNVLLIPVSAVTYAHDQATRKQDTFITNAQVTAALKDAQQQLLALQNRGASLTDEHPQISYVLIRQKEKWVPKGVVLGVTDGKKYEVLSGLTRGQKVATSDEKNWLVILRGAQ
jgi:HlyD family secretion protein